VKSSHYSGQTAPARARSFAALLGLIEARERFSGSIERLPNGPVASWRGKIAYLPQNPTYEPAQTVADVLRLGRAPYWSAFGIESPRDEKIVNDVAQSLALGDLLLRRMDQLSGGQRQRVFVGRCLVQEPLAMLLDEPNTFLDLKAQVDLSQLFRKLARERNIGLLLASHDLNLAGSFAIVCFSCVKVRSAAARRRDDALNRQAIRAAQTSSRSTSCGVPWADDLTFTQEEADDPQKSPPG